MSELQLVVKVGGSLATIDGALQRIGNALSNASEVLGLVVVPGGGPFADAVRRYTLTVGLGPDSAHWMAILAMDQYAYVIAERTPRGVVVETPEEALRVLRRDQVPVLAPYHWLRATDELPHRWEVTSDSLAAYLAGLLGVGRLVLVKPVSGSTEALTDPYFSQALPTGLDCQCVGIEDFESWLETSSRSGGNGSVQRGP